MRTKIGLNIYDMNYYAMVAFFFLPLPLSLRILSLIRTYTQRHQPHPNMANHTGHTEMAPNRIIRLQLDRWFSVLLLLVWLLVFAVMETD